MSITQSKCMTRFVPGVDAHARARTSAKFRSPRDISASHCAILLPLSGRPSVRPSSIRWPRGPFLPFFPLLSFSLSPLPHSRRDNEFHSAALQRIRYTFARHCRRRRRRRRRVPRRNAFPPSNDEEYVAAEAAVIF